MIILPQLHQHYVEHKIWDEEWAEQVCRETVNRPEMSRSSDFHSKGHGNKAPEGWEAFMLVKTAKRPPAATNN